jgi:hypothetical protein
VVRQVADGLRERLERLARCIDDLLAYMSSHADHWPNISSSNSLEP